MKIIAIMGLDLDVVVVVSGGGTDSLCDVNEGIIEVIVVGDNYYDSDD